MSRFAWVAVLALALGAAAPAVADDGTYDLRFGTLAPDNTPWSDILKEFKKRVQKDTKQRVKVKLFLGGSLGDERAMLEKMQYGELTGGGFSTGGISTRVPELQVLELPFLFRSSEEADHILDTVLLDHMAKRFEEEGLFLYIWAENGWLDFGCKTKPIVKAADCRGVKFFAQESDVQISFYKAVAAPATTLPVTEVLNSLQTGLIEAYSSTPIYAAGAQWFTQTKHWLDSDHMYQPAAVVFSLDFWKKLPDDLKQIMLGYRKELRDQARKDVRGIDAELFKGFADEGIRIARFTDADKAEFQKLTAGVVEEMIQKKVFSRDLYDKVVRALEEFRAGRK